MPARSFRRPAHTEALAVKLHGYAESSAVAVLLTERKGLVHAVAKGAKRISNGFRGPLDSCVLYRTRLGRRSGEGLHHLHTASVREAYPRLRSDPARFLAASVVVEVASDLMRVDEPHEELFRLTVFALKALDRAPRPRIGLVVAFFLARAVTLSGHEPRIGQCVACDRPLAPDERPLMSATRGGALHPECGQGEPGARMVSPSVLALLAYLWRRPAAEILAQDLPGDELRALRTLLESWLEDVLERRFRAAPLMEREIAGVRPSG